VLGVEADLSATSPLDRPKQVPAPFNTTFDYFGTVRGRVGYATGSLLPYVTGGLAWGRTRVDLNDVDGNVIGNKSRVHLGWVAGTGLEIALGGNWSGKVEYNYIDLGTRNYGLGDVPLPDVAVDPKIHTVKVGLNYRLWDAPPWVTGAAIKPLALPESTDWNVHGQTTLITQGYPSFRSPIRGRTACPEQAARARHGLSALSLAGGSGKAASFISTLNSIRASESEAHSASPASPTAKHKRAAASIRSFARSVISSARPSVLAAGRKMSRTLQGNCRASAISIGSP
jgi:high affinity Mn2+ porin